VGGPVMSIFVVSFVAELERFWYGRKGRGKVITSLQTTNLFIFALLDIVVGYDGWDIAACCAVAKDGFHLPVSTYPDYMEVEENDLNIELRKRARREFYEWMLVKTVAVPCF